MTTSELNNYQDVGSVKGFDSKALAAANSYIGAMETQTPLAVRHLFRRYIRRTKDGYEYGWVLKG